MPDEVLKTIGLKLIKNDYEVLVAGHPDKGTWSIDPDAKPKAMTVKGVKGPNAGKTFPCIYELDGDASASATTSPKRPVPKNSKPPQAPSSTSLPTNAKANKPVFLSEQRVGEFIAQREPINSVAQYNLWRNKTVDGPARREPIDYKVVQVRLSSPTAYTHAHDATARHEQQAHRFRHGRLLLIGRHHETAAK